jgi:hypothetical protein
MYKMLKIIKGHTTWFLCSLYSQYCCIYIYHMYTCFILFVKTWLNKFVIFLRSCYKSHWFCLGFYIQRKRPVVLTFTSLYSDCKIILFLKKRIETFDFTDWKLIFYITEKMYKCIIKDLRTAKLLALCWLIDRSGFKIIKIYGNIPTELVKEAPLVHYFRHSHLIGTYDPP